MQMTQTAAEQVRTAPHYFALLGCHTLSTTDEMTAARRPLARALHPDRGGDAEAMAMVNRAYAVLADAAARRKYLAELMTGRKPCIPCKGTGAKRVAKGFTSVALFVCPKCLGCGLV